MIVAPRGFPALQSGENGKLVLASAIRAGEQAAQHLLLERRPSHPCCLDKVTINPSGGTTLYLPIARGDIEGPILLWVSVVGSSAHPDYQYTVSLTVAGVAKTWLQGADSVVADMLVMAAAGGGFETFTLLLQTTGEGPVITGWGAVSLPYSPDWVDGGYEP